jgi:hypothetical protein
MAKAQAKTTSLFISDISPLKKVTEQGPQPSYYSNSVNATPTPMVYEERTGADK